jgi:thiaminase/transcriptional activator TenA
MTAPDYGHAFGLWRSQAGETWDAYTRHEFVSGLSDGTLPRAAFLHYLVQDYIFLFHFSRAWALAAVKADAPDEMRIAATTLDALVNHEMPLHIGICAEAGIDEAALIAAREEPENIAYTRYVLDAGFSGDFLDLLAALAPCVMGYGEIGARLAQDATGDTYRQWIDTYADPAYQQVCIDVGALIDAALLRRLGENWQSTPRAAGLSHRFTTATGLEVDFWSMGLRGA